MVITATSRIEDTVLITIFPAPITPPARALPFVLSRLVRRCCMWYLSFSLPSVELWSCNWCR